MAGLDVLIPTYRRPAALAVTLASLVGQTRRDFRVVVSDQSEHDALAAGEVQAVVRTLRHTGREVVLHRHLPRRGLAEHRQFLLDHATAPRALFLDDDLTLEPDVLARLVDALDRAECGFVGMSFIGLSFAGDERLEEEAVFEPWEGPVRPERVEPGTPAWERYRLHNAANLLHLAQRLGLRADDGVLYKVAWAAGCVLYDTAALRAAGGYAFWRELPAEHCGEDVLAQLQVMERFGGCGLLPSGVFHQELETTVPDRSVNAPQVLRFAPEPA